MVVLLLLLSAPMAASHAQESPSVQQLLEVAREHAKAEKAEADQRRFTLIEQAVRLREKEKEAAKGEREQLELNKQKLQQQIDLRRWALGTFEQREQKRLPPADNLDRRVRQWERVQDQWKHIFLSSREQSRGAIARGRALNFFLDICGSVAVEHQLAREQLRQQLELDQVELTRLNSVLRSPAAAGAERDGAQLELDRLAASKADLAQKQELLESLRGGKALTEDHHRKLLFTRGTLGGEIVYSARDGALPLNWPALMVTTPEFRPYLKDLEAAREQGLAELSAGQGISPKTQAALLTAADNIKDQWTRFKKKALADRGRSEVDCQRYVTALRFVTALRSGVLRFAEARETSDVEPTEPFRGERIDELLVYMSKQGVRFAPADGNSEYVYDVLYRQLVDYYSKLNSLRMAVQSNVDDVQQIAQRDEQLFKTQHQSVMEELERALKAEPPRDFASQFVDLAVGIHAIADAAALSRGR